MSFVKLLKEFGDRNVEYTDEKLSTIVAGWNEAIKMFVAQASLEKLQEVKDSLQKLASWNGTCCYDPVHEAAKIGAMKLMEFVLRTSFDMNTKGDCGWTAWHLACSTGKTETAQLIIRSSKDFGIDLNTKDDGGRTAWHEACYYGKTETAQLIIQSSNDFGIDLNAKDDSGWTGLHEACYYGKTETVQMILKNWKEFGIDIKAQDDDGETALDLINEEDEEYDEIKKMLEEEYSQIDVTESVQS